MTSPTGTASVSHCECTRMVTLHISPLHGPRCAACALVYHYNVSRRLEAPRLRAAARFARRPMRSFRTACGVPADPPLPDKR